MNWLAAIAAGLVSGTLGALGLGGGSVLILWLTLGVGMEQIAAQGINLVFFLPCALVAILLHARKKRIRWKLWLLAAPVGVLGALLGSVLAKNLDSGLLGQGFAVLLLVFGLCEVFHRKKSREEEEC